MKTIFNPWQSISGSICLNIFICLVDSEPEKIDDLAIPICCSLYLSKNWKRLNFSNTDKINDLRKYVSPETLGIQEVLLTHTMLQEKIKETINTYKDHLNGSLSFSIWLLDTLFESEPSKYENDYRTLFQDSWEICFWYLQDLTDESLINLICDFPESQIENFEHVMKFINSANP